MESVKKKRKSKNGFLVLLIIDLFLFLLLCATIAGGFFAAKVFAQQVKETDEANVQAMYAKAETAGKVNIPNALRSYTCLLYTSISSRCGFLSKISQTNISLVIFFMVTSRCCSYQQTLYICRATSRPLYR